MYAAWRARIGLIKPTHRGKSFAFWYKHAPDGVEIVPTFIGFRSGERQSFTSGFQRAEALAADLQAVGCTIISVSGTPPFLLKGLDFERQWARDLSAKVGLPVVTPMEPHARAAGGGAAGGRGRAGGRGGRPGGGGGGGAAPRPAPNPPPKIKVEVM